MLSTYSFFFRLGLTMNAVVKAAREQTLCPVCGDRFKEPKTLSCVHSFCKKCIADHIVKTTKNQSDPSAFNCPVCQKETPKPDNGPTLTWADHLQTNDALTSILEAFESGTNLRTCPHHSDKEIEFYCEDHSLSLCSWCATIAHKKCEGVVPIEEAAERRRIDSWRLANVLMEQSSHTEKILNDRRSQLESLDRTEDDIKARLTNLRKKTMEALDALENKVINELMLKKNKETEVLRLEVETCEDILKDTRECLESFQESVQNEQPIDFVTSYLKQFEMFQNRQIALLNFSKNLKSVKVIFITDRSVDQILKQIKSLGTLSVEKTPSRYALPYAKSYTESRQSVLQTPRSISLLHRGSTSYRPMSRASIVKDSQSIPSYTSRPISFRHRAISTYSKASSVEPFRNKQESQNTSPTPRSGRLDGNKTTRDLTQSRPSADIMAKNGKLIQAKLRSTFDASTPDQNECSIEGATVLASGHVVLADSYHSSLKLFDQKYSYIGCIKFSTAPGDVTAFQDDEVIVCLPDTKQLKHEKLKNNKLIPGESLAVGDRCTSASYNNGILATCSGSTVHVFKREEGRWIRILLQKLDVDNLMYIAVDKEGERIVVTKNGYPNRPVLCLNKNGQKIWSFTHEEIRLPRGIAFFGDQILVVSWDQQRILQLNKEGKLVGAVVKDGLQWPWKLCISPLNDKLFVTQCYYRLSLKEKNTIKVFSLK